MIICDCLEALQALGDTQNLRTRLQEIATENDWDLTNPAHLPLLQATHYALLQEDFPFTCGRCAGDISHLINTLHAEATPAAPTPKGTPNVHYP